MTSYEQASAAVRGFTLVEVMVGIVLTSILILGLTALFATIADEFNRLTLRQKAIFALNGELERLTALYKFETFSLQSVDIDDVPGAATKFNMVIYPETYVPSQGSSNDFIDNGDGFVEGEIFYFDNGNGAGDDDRLLVWLDRANLVVGRFYWDRRDFDTAAATQCTIINDGPCLIDAYMDYPWRFDESTETLEALTPINTVSIQTLMGQR